MFLHDTSLKIFSILFSAIFFCINADNSPAGGLLDKQTQLNNNIPGLFPPPNNRWTKQITELNAHFMACVNGVIKDAYDKDSKDDDYLNDCYKVGDIIDGSLKEGDAYPLAPQDALFLFRAHDMVRHALPFILFAAHDQKNRELKTRQQRVVEYVAATLTRSAVREFHYIKNNPRYFKSDTGKSKEFSPQFLSILQAAPPVGALLLDEAFKTAKNSSSLYDEYGTFLNDILQKIALLDIDDPSRENFFPFTILMNRVYTPLICLWADRKKQPSTIWEWLDIQRYGNVKPKCDSNQTDITLNIPGDERLKTLEYHGLLEGPATFRMFNAFLYDDTMYSPRGAIESKLPVNLQLSKDLFSNEGIELMYYFFLGSFSNVEQSGLPICGKPILQVNLNLAISAYINDTLTPTLKEIQNKVSKKDAPVSPLNPYEDEIVKTAYEYAIWFNMFRLVDAAFLKSGSGYVWDRTLNPNRFAGFDRITADNIDYICKLFAAQPK